MPFLRSQVRDKEPPTVTAVNRISDFKPRPIVRTDLIKKEQVKFKFF